ncbi:funZ protein [Methanosarcina sp. KYL-1]|uniref:P-loop ATPase, Sll1717 family n=1 Tax=Methanosarcina sp. KYL-1 TaxID=2602068 RepID=UPI0021014AFB|nr:hypothetical protein [Methanosarcina sp. KYL-1]MCQ1537368.1 funZ protein [Methanosarcina sp. KYL-1]
MFPVPELNFGFNDAQNYRRRENKEFFNRIFIRTDSLEKLCGHNVFFLVGEKGTGKTAYAVYISNNSYRENSGTIKDIRETEYRKFITLKEENHLQLSDYTNIWKVIIYLLISQQIKEKESNNFVDKFIKFRNLQRAIDEFYSYAFSPEIIYAINFVEDSKIAAELIAQYSLMDGQIGGEKRKSISFEEKRFQIRLLYIQNKFEEALRSLKLTKNHILFIDGVDIRASSVSYEEYLECVKGLANAVWAVNNDFFASIKDTKGRLRVVLLVRPDIFESLGLQNQNNKLRDNSVLLDWRTKYTDYRTSQIFEIADNLLKFQQDDRLEVGDSWDYYFPYDTPNVKSKQEKYSSFIYFLRYSLYRPRDIITMLNILQENFTIKGKKTDEVFSIDDFEDPDFKDKLSNYFLGEIKDQLSFYYSKDEYEHFLKFFEFLKGKHKFPYDQYLRAYSNFCEYLSDNNYKKPSFCESADTFLQFLYDLNIICYKDETYNEDFMRWCFRERNYANISPKVKKDSEYIIHYGMRKALNLGKVIF